MKVLVINSCTGEKKFAPANQLVQDDFRDAKTLKTREAELKEFALPAAEMYTGMQHLRLMEGLKLLRESFPKDLATFDLAIVSAGYGLIAEGRKIVPYEVTFNTMKNPEIDAWASERRIPEDLAALLPRYDMAIFLLGEKYLKACRFAESAECPHLLFFASGKSGKFLPTFGDITTVELSNADAKDFGYGLVGLKGYLFKCLAQDLVRTPALLDQIIADPESALAASLLSHRKSAPPEQPLLFELPPATKAPAKRFKKGLDIVIPRCD